MDTEERGQGQMSNQSKIEWCDHTFNMITGCRHHCDYCYANRLTARFGGNIKENLKNPGYRKEGDLFVLEKPFYTENGALIHYPFGFEPTLHLYRKDSLDRYKGGARIFVGAMADVFGDWVPTHWIDHVFEACEEHPKNNYLFLTKNPKRYQLLDLPAGNNWWYGTTITRNAELGRIELLPEKRKCFLSIEPILEELFIPAEDLMGIDWIIIGAETGRRKGKVIPEFKWVKRLVLQADAKGIPVFMKDSMIPIVGEKNMRRDYPKQLLLRLRGDAREAKETDICAKCKAQYDKNEMVTIISRVGRNGVARRIAFMCRDCYEEWTAGLGVDGKAEEIFTMRIPRTRRKKDGGYMEK